MKTLVIYDSSGTIFSSPITDGYIKPQLPLNFLEVEIPEGKVLNGVDTSVTPNIPVYEEILKTELQLANERIEALEKEADNTINNL